MQSGVGSWKSGVAMLSESARMSSAAEAKFRLPAPASVARVVTVIGLDPAGEEVVARLALTPWPGVRFFPALALTDEGALEDIADGDLVVMVVAAGADAGAAARIGRACSDRRVHTATFVLRDASTTDAALSATLAQVRPWSLMVVIASDRDYVGDLLRSFR